MDGKFQVNVVEKVSKKTDNPYTVLEVVFPNGYTKIVFLDDAEKFLLQ